eukprot:TRINITY_DN5434_c0_g1_i1.p1 TRINITY_DN5434_c0_g1~~TRINITY_DN5434_c0_g1_i1.p1  ORF type:complete len:452 (-),score=115.83 TRINITY_DN5434_c0_g1_i1:91-1275(-)
MAKKAVGRLGEMVGEEVLLTVQDFKEKGAVGAVKDAVADAGDILIDGVAGIVGWVRGDPAEEEESAAAEDAEKVLANGPRGAAYGVSQASPTGGINAVWVMPEEADPATLAELAAKQAPGGSLANPPYAPAGIQPYCPPGAKATPQFGQPGFSQPGFAQMPQTLPNGIQIAPYQPAGAPGFRAPPFVPGGQFQQNQPGAAFPPAFTGGYNPNANSAAASGGVKGFIEQISTGSLLPGSEVVTRLAGQCAASQVSGKQLGEFISDRVRRAYLGLDGGDPSKADASILRMLELMDAMSKQDAAIMRDALKNIKTSVSEELLSLQSNAKHKDAALPIMRRLGLLQAPAEMPDLLGSDVSSSSPAQADLLGDTTPAKEVDLLGVGAPQAQGSTDLLGF